MAGPHDLNRPGPASDDGWRTYTCGHCGAETSGAVLAVWERPSGVRTFGNVNAVHRDYWLRCTRCGQGTIETHAGAVAPSPPRGFSVRGLPPDTAAAYDEARQCMGLAAYTAVELVCRKILMHVSVDKGAQSVDGFATYVGYLEAAGYVTPAMRSWVDLIRARGNAANHELPATTKEQAEGTLLFTGQMLRMVYEMEHQAKHYAHTGGA